MENRKATNHTSSCASASAQCTLCHSHGTSTTHAKCAHVAMCDGFVPCRAYRKLSNRWPYVAPLRDTVSMYNAAASPVARSVWRGSGIAHPSGSVAATSCLSSMSTRRRSRRDASSCSTRSAGSHGADVILGLSLVMTTPRVLLREIARSRSGQSPYSTVTCVVRLVHHLHPVCSYSLVYSRRATIGSDRSHHRICLAGGVCPKMSVRIALQGIDICSSGSLSRESCQLRLSVPRW